VTLAELTTEGTRWELKAPMEVGRDRQAREAELRERAQSALRDRGLLPTPQ
jgi:hypothetical protein